MYRPNAWTACLAVVLAAMVSIVSIGPSRAATQTFTLYGDAATGWGSTNTTLASPGPTIRVNLNDNVSLTLNATDGTNHNWFIDYDNNTNDGPIEPNSVNFQDQQIVFNFTADTAGTYAYRCKFHPAVMWGLIVIQNGSSTPPAADNTALIVGGVVIAFVVVMMLFYIMTRKPKKQTKKSS